MGRVLLILVFGIFLFRMEFVQNAINPPRDYSHLKEVVPVTLFSTSWCGYCAKTRRFFERNNIDYVEYDIEKSEPARKKYDALGGGGVPVVLVDDRIVRGYNTSLILNHLDDLAPVTN